MIELLESSGYTREEAMYYLEEHYSKEILDDIKGELLNGK